MQTRIIRLLLLASCCMFALQAHAGSILYQNGPVNGICDIEGCTVDAWTINVGFSVTDSFTISTPSTIQGFNIAVWLYPEIRYRPSTGRLEPARSARSWEAGQRRARI